MAFLVQGNAEQIFQAFGQDCVIKVYDDADDLSTINKDLPRTPFLGTEAQAKTFINTWRTGKVFSQGNTSGGSLCLLLGNENPPLMQKDEEIMDYAANYVRDDFGFVNDKQEPCGLMLLYRRDHPDQWLLGFTVNSHLEPKDRTVILLSGFDLAPYIKSNMHGVKVVQTDVFDNPLMEQIDLPIIRDFLQNKIKAEQEEIDPDFAELSLLPTFIRNTELNPELVNPNRARDLIIQYKLHLSPVLLRDYLSENGKLRPVLEGLTLTEDEALDKSILQMVLVFYKDGVLEQSQNVLQNHDFIRDMRALMWDEEQIRLLPVLVTKPYSRDLVQSILINPAYYHSYALLAELGITQHFQEYFAYPEKKEQLSFIDALGDENSKKLCLIFWGKGHFTLQELKELVAATEKYPMLAATLIDLDQTKTVISIKELQKLALRPQIHLQKSIAYHYSAEFKDYQLKKSDLKNLDEKELIELSRSLDVLRKAGITQADAYKLVLKQNNQGQILRMFLPGLALVENTNHRNELINLLYKGIQKGIPTQGKAVLEMKDTELLPLAQDLYTRYICVNQMQELKFNNEIVALAAANNVQSDRFRQIILKVEAQCKGIHERLLKSSSDRDKVGKWQRADEEYRKTIYCIAYDGITQSGVDLSARIHEAEKNILNIVDPEITSWLQKVLIVIANILITTFTLGFANDVKKRNTGNYWFFTQTPSGEEIRALDKEVLSFVEDTDAAPAVAP
ncbi:hypothetical protein [Legionella shakespearei]|uniref:Uncharacterized protein n=1 Tax=Legionella shakespearei DSM 23087 TaxID=1122169 RepID=A0A0W0YZZ3_9GAMM|nr:hypothetical protein [Legionella shakespearei]KTD62453.1 hypothetical protein Lsha_1153 [Legionella shakespearei DSM 23087]